MLLRGPACSATRTIRLPDRVPGSASQLAASSSARAARCRGRSAWPGLYALSCCGDSSKRQEAEIGVSGSTGWIAVCFSSSVQVRDPDRWGNRSLKPLNTLILRQFCLFILEPRWPCMAFTSIRSSLMGIDKMDHTWSVQTCVPASPRCITCRRWLVRGQGSKSRVDVLCWLCLRIFPCLWVWLSRIKRFRSDIRFRELLS